MTLWVGQSASLLGAQVTLLAMPLTAVVTLKASPFQVGLVSASQTAPVLVLTPLAGVWADGHSHRRLMLLTNLGRAAALLAIPLLAAIGRLEVWSLCLLGVAVGAMTAVFDVVLQSTLPDVVPTDALVAANARLEASYSASQMAGPALAGFIARLWTPAMAMALDGMTKLTAFEAARRLRDTPPCRRASAGIRRTLGAIRDGFRHAFEEPRVSALLLQAAWFNLWEQVVLVVYVIFAVRVLSLDSWTLGVTFTVGGACAVVGAAGARALGARLGRSTSLIVGIGLASLSPALIPATPAKARLAMIAILGLAWGVYGFGLTVFNVHAVSLRQEIIPRNRLGRVTATYRFASFGTIPLGAALGGAAASRLGARTTLWLAAALLAAGWAVFTLRFRSLSRGVASSAARPAMADRDEAMGGRP